MCRSCSAWGRSPPEANSTGNFRGPVKEQTRLHCLLTRDGQPQFYGKFSEFFLENCWSFTSAPTHKHMACLINLQQTDISDIIEILPCLPASRSSRESAMMSGMSHILLTCAKTRTPPVLALMMCKSLLPTCQSHDGDEW